MRRLGIRRVPHWSVPICMHDSSQKVSYVILLLIMSITTYPSTNRDILLDYLTFPDNPLLWPLTCPETENSDKVGTCLTLGIQPSPHQIVPILTLFCHSSLLQQPEKKERQLKTAQLFPKIKSCRI